MTVEGDGLMKHGDAEKPTGQWTYCVGTTAVHVVNGKEAPLDRGRIQLQSEGAEVFYRRLRVEAIPAEYAAQAK
jgi:hypothetical protein